jgi:hypothetical protein
MSFSALEKPTESSLFPPLNAADGSSPAINSSILFKMPKSFVYFSFDISRDLLATNGKYLERRSVAD